MRHSRRPDFQKISKNKMTSLLKTSRTQAERSSTQEATSPYPVCNAQPPWSSSAWMIELA